MKVIAKSREDYFRQTGERQDDLRAVDNLIQEHAPSLTPFFLKAGGTFLGYGPYHYKYASGREGDWAIVLLANQKNHMSLYICVAKDGHYLPELYKDALGRVNCGKSCIRFKKLTDLNLASFKTLLKEAEKLAQDKTNFQM